MQLAVQFSVHCSDGVLPHRRRDKSVQDESGVDQLALLRVQRDDADVPVHSGTTKKVALKRLAPVDEMRQ